MLAAVIVCLAAAGPVEGARLPPRWPADLAVGGFDVVSYFTGEAGAPRAGSDRLESGWRGATWRFASAANLAAFRADPEVYAPRLHGYDPGGILAGRIVDSNPLVFAVLPVSGTPRLYLFRNAETRDRFVAEPALAGEAEARWPGLRALTDTGAE